LIFNRSFRYQFVGFKIEKHETYVRDEEALEIEEFLSFYIPKSLSGIWIHQTKTRESKSELFHHATQVHTYQPSMVGQREVPKFLVLSTRHAS